MALFFQDFSARFTNKSQFTVKSKQNSKRKSPRENQTLWKSVNFKSKSFVKMSILPWLWWLGSWAIDGTLFCAEMINDWNIYMEFRLIPFKIYADIPWNVLQLIQLVKHFPKFQLINDFKLSTQYFLF